MDSMDIIGNVVNIFLLNKLSPDIAGFILALGAITSFIFFFRTDEWRNKLSDLDKLILSGLVGYILWSFLIAPITIAYYIFGLYYMPEPYSFEEAMRLASFAFILFSICFVVFLPKNYNFNDFHVIISCIKSIIKYLLLFTPIIIIFFFLAFFFSIYRNQAINTTGNLIVIEAIWLLWYFILGAINKDKFADFDITFNINNKKISMIIIGLFAISIIGGILVGIYYNNPSIIKSSKLERIEISEIPVNKFYGILPANFIYNTTFEIKFGLVKWVNIESNYTITQAYNSDNNSKKYEWNGTSIFLRGNDKTNLTVFESKTQNISKNFYIFSKKYTNSYQEWNITLNNTDKAKINVATLDILPYTQADEKLRLISISSDGISYNSADMINKSMGSNGFTIYNILVEPNEKRSITLYFSQ